MFYVCYIVNAQKYSTFPPHWLKDHRRQLTKYINNGINCGQRLLAFYSEKMLEEIENGRPASECRPNFQASLSVVFPAEGCYMVIPKKYCGKRLSA